MKFKHLLACMAFIPASLIASVSYAEGLVTGISAPGSAAQGTPVSVTLTGNGFCDSYTINWGDTHSNTISGPATLPHTPPSHTYTSPGTKSISVASHPGCIGGTVSTSINITGVVVPDNPTISSITGSSCAKKGSSYKIKVNGSGGSGICATLNVNWGAGEGSNNYTNHNLTASPWRSHTYNSLGTKTITASGADGCSGTKTRTITVRSSCIGGIVFPDLRWLVKIKWPLRFIPPRGPVCLSCPPWLRKIRAQEKYQNGLVRQLKRYQGMTKSGKRLSKSQMRNLQQLHKNLQRSEGQRQKLIGSHKRAFSKRGVMKKGTMPRRGMQNRMMPNKGQRIPLPRP